MPTVLNRFKTREIIAYVIGIILLLVVAAKILGNEDYTRVIHRISYFNMIISLMISFFLFFLNGYVIAYLVGQQYRRRSIKFLDMAMLPFMMHLCGYIIPFRGALLFSALFLKMKYGIRGTEGIAIGVYTLIINLMITGLCGLYYTYTKHIFFSGWTFLSLLFIASPIIVWLLDQILDRVVLKSFSLLNNIKILISSISHSSQKLLIDYKTSIVMFLFTVASLIVFIFLIFWITIVFNIHTGLDKIIMFALMMRLSTLVRLVPGNLGIQELFSGGVFYIIGGSLNDGLAIALFVRFLSIVLAFTIGTIGIAVNLKHFKLGGLKKMWEELTKANYPDAVSDDGINSS